MSPDDAYALLAFALRNLAPPCSGHDMFVSAELTELERTTCSSICARCPITDLCDSYATASGVDLGFWGGKGRSPKRRRASSTTADRTVSGTQEKEERS